MTPKTATAARSFLDPKTGQTWTLTYTRGSLGHTVRLEPPFGERCSAPTHTDDLDHARRIWRLIQSNVIRWGFVPA